ncbi:DUF998 domain-containing protein [Bacillus sp. JCM 19041]|uniref:DUF998 domain-containing protein n=1 Tax=Bacillus sp. JCM 19041 TaxID=1460637 RepID=UPI0006D0AEDD
MRIPSFIGIGSWIVAAAYFLYEPLAIAASQATYSAIQQPMSDLGVTECGLNTYPWADYDICSPHAAIVNGLFLLTAISISVGAFYLYQESQKSQTIKVAVGLLLVFSIGNGFSVIPANVHFNWHTVPAMVAMVAVIPAIGLFGLNTIKGKWLSYICCFLTLLILVGFILIAFFSLEIGGLLQRVFYGLIYSWGIGMSIVITNRKTG